jgi:hypothetical protein
VASGSGVLLYSDSLVIIELAAKLLDCKYQRMLVSDPAQGGGQAALPTHGSRVLTGPGCAVTLNVPNRTWRLVSAVIMLAGITLLLVLSQLIDCRTRGREREEATRYHSDRSFRVPGSLQGLGVPRRLAPEAVAVAGGLVPTREELVRSWVYTGAAKGEGVLRAEQDVARTLQAGGHPVDQAANSSAAALTSVMYLKKRARGIDDILTEPLGVVLSSARHTAWLGDCLPFIKALNASERQSATVAPVEFRPKNAVPLSRQIASVVSAALAAVALGRPFRAAVGSAFAKGYVRPNLFNWKVHRDHYDLVKEKRPHITFESVRDMLHTGGGMTGGLASDQAAEFDLQTLLLERAELPPEELLPVLARRLSRFGGMGQVDMEQVRACVRAPDRLGTRITHDNRTDMPPLRTPCRPSCVPPWHCFDRLQPQSCELRSFWKLLPTSKAPGC